MTHSPSRDALERWVTGDRVMPLPGTAHAGAPEISFEFFPPKTPELAVQLWSCVERLATLKPRFVQLMPFSHRAAGNPSYFTICLS